MNQLKTWWNSVPKTQKVGLIVLAAFVAAVVITTVSGTATWPRPWALVAARYAAGIAIIAGAVVAAAFVRPFGMAVVAFSTVSATGMVLSTDLRQSHRRTRDGNHCRNGLG